MPEWEDFIYNLMSDKGTFETLLKLQQRLLTYFTIAHTH